MKAVVQNRYGSPDYLELQEIDRPVAADDGVLLKVRAASVNAADWHLLKRLPHLIGKILGMPMSRVRGGDVAGVVEAVGRNVKLFQPGDEVFGGGIGTFAEYATALENRLAPKPENLTFEEAAALPGAGSTALQGLRDKGQLREGQSVLIYGAGGGVGTLAVAIAKSLGGRVTAVTRTENIDLMRSLGADDVIDYGKEDFTERPERYDLIFDIGGDRSFADCRRVLAPGGKLVLVGAPPGVAASLWRLLEGQLAGSRGGQRVSFLARVRREDLIALKELAEAGTLRPVIDRTYPLSEVPEALRYVGSRNARGKVVIHVD